MASSSTVDLDKTDSSSDDQSGFSENTFLGDQMHVETVGTEGVMKKSEFIRIITEALYSLGFDKSGALLEEESGIPMHTCNVKLFLQKVKAGEWDESIATLHKLELGNEKIVNSASFLLLRQKYFEFLKIGKTADALDILRKDIAYLDVKEKRVNELASKIITISSDQSDQDMESLNSRSKILEQLRNLLPTGLIIPEKRLEFLVEKSFLMQRDLCVLHNIPDSDLSLCSDHDHCNRGNIPCETVQILESHTDEVWYLQFSHNGKYLASSSKDKSAIIWEINAERYVALKHKLIGHSKTVVSVLWSPDDTQVITCGAEEDIRRWDVESGICLYLYEKIDVGPASCAWFPDGNCIVGAMSDLSICIWNLDGTVLENWSQQRFVSSSDVAITDDSKWIISMHLPSVISMLNRETSEEKLIYMENIITSFTLSRDNEHLLVNLIDQQICLYSIKNGAPYYVRSYKGFKRNRFVIRSCFGGYEQNFIASGSEDSKVYIWFRGRDVLLSELQGHSGVVNCVSWNPVLLQMLGSASDDGTIRIWGRKQGNKRKRESE